MAPHEKGLGPFPSPSRPLPSPPSFSSHDGGRPSCAPELLLSTSTFELTQLGGSVSSHHTKAFRKHASNYIAGNERPGLPFVEGGLLSRGEYTEHALQAVTGRYSAPRVKRCHPFLCQVNSFAKRRPALQYM